VSCDLLVKGIQDQKNEFSGSVEGKVPHFYFKGYEYQNLALNGVFNKKGFEGKASLDDENAKLNFSGLVDLSKQSPTFNFDLIADKVNLQPLNLTTKAGITSLSFHLHSDFEGRVMDDLQGQVTIDSLNVVNKQERFYLNHLQILAGNIPGNKYILINSNLLNGEIRGNYKFSTLPKSLRSIAKFYFPSMFKPEIPYFAINNDFTFNGTLLPSSSLAKVLGLPFIIEDKLVFNGFYNDRTGKFRVKADVPKLTYGKLPVQSLGLLLENPQGETKFLAFARIGSGDKEMKFNVDTRSSNNNTAFKLNISNSSLSTYSGNIQSDVNFSRRTDGALLIDAKLRESNIILNDSVWNMHPTDFRWEDHRLYVEDFQLTHSGQFIKIQGYASENSSDTLNVLLNSFSLDDVFLLLPKATTNIHFGGLVSGHSECVRLLKNPAMNADLSVDNFSFNHAVIGHLTAKSKWNNAMRALVLDAEIRSNQEIEGVNRKIATASGAYFPVSDSMFLSINADRLPVNFLEPYLGKILYNLQGVASGNAHLIGPMKQLGVYAQAYVENVSFGIQMLNTRYSFSDSVLVSPRIVVFRNVIVKDREGNVAKATGILRHQYFKNMQTSIDIQAKNLLAMDIPPSPDAFFYGTAYATGTVSINGPQDNITIDINARTEDKTKATISIKNKNQVTENSFIKFIQKKKVNEDYDLDLKKKPILPEAFNIPTNLTVDLKIEATPNAELTLIPDPNSSDEIKARGNGAIRAVFNNANDMQLFGRYTIENGSYKFIYENLLRRDFNIENGGSINFSGDPLAAELNIKANYTVNANLSDLLSTEALSSLNLNRSSIPVNCVLKLDGELQKPGIQLDLAFPSADDNLKKQIANVINTDEMVNQQIVFLMLFGRFSTPSYTTSVQSSTSGMSTALNTTISTVSSQLNNMINDVFGKSKMSFDFDYRNAAYELGTPGEWKVGMSGQWLDNRLTFNGNLGTRENLVQTNKSQFIGEFDFNLKLKNSEKWSARFFNKANDNRYFKSALNTQGLGLVYKEDFNKVSDLFKQMVESLQKPFRKEVKSGSN
ncbi:MAG TPA: translocation/assembly module TamB domain-containing protein, partial [Bacteroidales bacterium]